MTRDFCNDVAGVMDLLIEFNDIGSEVFDALPHVRELMNVIGQFLDFLGILIHVFEVNVSLQVQMHFVVEVFR